MLTTHTHFVLGLLSILLASPLAHAETHTISFDNRCGKGTPQLIIGGKVVSKGEPYTFTGTAAGIAYLQTGECDFNGEKCTLLEFNLANPTCPGCSSSTDISLIAPHAFNVEASFSYYNGCDGQGATCASGTCKTAFFVPNDNQVQVQCEETDVNLLFTFCGDGTKASTGPATSSPTQTEAGTVQTPAASPQTSSVPEQALVLTTSSSASISASSSTPTVSHGSCKSKRRRANFASHRRRRRGEDVTWPHHGSI